jgi:type VI secretion system protein ImpA
MLESHNTTDFVAGLLRPLPGSSCGIDLEYDADFLALERLVQGKPQQQMGSAVVPGEEPTWNLVLEKAVALFGRTKDLRIAVTLARALLAQGFAGLCDGLSLLRGLVEQHWNEVYPRLDPADGNDPTFRLNVLSGLCDGPTFTDRVRALPLVVSRSFGRFSLRDLAVASGESAAQPGGTAPQASVIDGAFSECALTDLQATEAQLRGALDHLLALEKALAARIGQAKGPDFSPLARLLQQGHKVVSGHLARRDAVAPTPAAEASQPAPPSPTSDTVSSREDVVRLLDRICAYYDRHEPASPLPLLLRRCKRLVSASFFEIVRDLAPAGLPQVETLRGKDA